MSKYNFYIKIAWVAIIVFCVAVFTVLGGCSDNSANRTNSVLFVNDTSRTMYHLLISESSSSSWGPNQLGDGPLAPGESIRITNISCPTEYDFKAVYNSGSSIRGTPCSYSLEQNITCGTSWQLTFEDSNLLSTAPQCRFSISPDINNDQPTLSSPLVQ